jgi:hypothetical protein
MGISSKVLYLLLGLCAALLISIFGEARAVMQGDAEAVDLAAILAIRSGAGVILGFVLLFVGLVGRSRDDSIVPAAMLLGGCVILAAFLI